MPTFIGGIYVYDIENAQTTSQHVTDVKIKHCELSYGDNYFLIGGDKLTSRHNVVCIFDLDVIKQRTAGNKDLDLALARHKKVYSSDEHSITGLRFGYLNKTVFLATNRGNVEVWDFSLQNKLNTVKIFERPINSLNFSRRHEFLLLTSDIGTKVYDAETLELVTELRSEYPINCSQMSPLMYKKENPRFHVIMGGGTKARDTAFAKEGGLEINIMNAIHGSRVAQLSGHYGPINWIEICPDGAGFVSAGEEAIVRYYRFDKKYFDSPEFD